LGAIEMIYPGHGEPGAAGLIERNRTYLTRFLELSRNSEDADQLYDGMTELYPAHRLPFFLRRAADGVKGTPDQ